MAAPGRSAGLLALPPADPCGDTTVLLLAGERKRITRSMSRWSAQRPETERWALVRASGDAQSMPPPSELDVVDFAGGCACCVAASAFSLTLARLLRRGPVDRLFITLAESADPGKVADALWAGPLASRLAGVEIVGVVAPDTPERLMSGLARAGLGAADVLLLDSQSDAQFDGLSDRPSEPSAPAPGLPRALQESLSRADPGADPDIVLAPPAGLDWPELRARLGAVREPSRWRWLAAAPALASDGMRQRWTWPAAVVFDRRRAEAALHALALHPALAELRAVVHTRREWYAWRAGADEPSWTPTVSRRESRVECRTLPDVPIDLAAIASTWEAALAR